MHDQQDSPFIVMVLSNMRSVLFGLLAVFWVPWVSATVTLYHGPSKDFMIKTQIASNLTIDALVTQGKWVLVDTGTVQGWATIPALYNNGYMNHQEYLAFRQNQAEQGSRTIELFWQSERALGLAARLPFESWVRQRWPETAEDMFALWPGDQQEWVVRYHRGNQGEQAWHSLQTGVDSRLGVWNQWAWHLYLGGGVGINELLSRHWDDTGASRTVPLVAGAIDLRYPILEGMDMALRFETSQAFGDSTAGRSSGSNASHSAVSLVWILML